jgi:hypothetical protein
MAGKGGGKGGPPTVIGFPAQMSTVPGFLNVLHSATTAILAGPGRADNWDMEFGNGVWFMDWIVDHWVMNWHAHNQLQTDNQSSINHQSINQSNINQSIHQSSINQ